MKKRTAVMAFLLLSALLFSCFSPPAMAASGEVSDAVLIPLDDWRSGFGVAAVCSDSRLLLISELALDCQPYDTGKNRAATWDTCTLRRWLNDDFLKEAFSDADLVYILPTENFQAS